MARIIGVVNQKGGVGKTTTTTNLAAALAARGRKVLVLDIDPQANCTTHLGVSSGDDLSDPELATEQAASMKTIYDVLKSQCDIAQARVRRSDGLDVVPSSLFLSAADLELGGVVGRELLLRRALAPVADEYDIVLIDCPPALGLLSLNALAAVNEVIVPVQSEYLALHGVRQLLDTIDQVRSIYNPSLKVGGVLICLHDNRRKLAREVADIIRTYFGDLVFNTVIRANVSLAEAPSEGKSIFEYAPKSPGAEDYRALAEEVDRA